MASGVAVFTYAKSLLDAAAPDDAASRAHAVNHNGYLLLEAPTGAGKTLVAGHIVERFSQGEEVVWFWFAPFKGVVGQTAAFLREEFAGLRLRELAEDRAAAGSRAGDVFVLTWGTVATRAKDRRNVRRTGEMMPSVDELVEALRAQGLRIGVVVDEAHHGFHADTQAALFFRETLRPEYTVLITATPDDADLADFERRMGVAKLHRTSVSREDAVEAGLIKAGIKCVAYFAAEGQRALVDFEGTALRDGTALHRRLKTELATAGVALAPLMLVQVASSEGVERAKTRLLALGFTERQIAVHTAEEPDAGLLALANDEEREVLIFKMAVALGFDAPRAWTLVSMRAARDADFGVQLVGRILRVHRRLQGRKLPEWLRHGYVFLADAEAQTGLDAAGQRINGLRTAYAKVTPTTALVMVAGQPMVQVLGPGGQTSLFQNPTGTTPPAEDGAERDGRGEGAAAGEQGASDSGGGSFALELLLTSMEEPGRYQPAGEGGLSRTGGGTGGAPTTRLARRYHYPIRPEVPRRFRSQVLPADFAATEADCARKFTVSARDLLRAIAGRVRVQTRTLEVFTQQMEFGFSQAALSPEQVAVEAQRLLLRSQVFDAKELRGELLRRLADILREENLDGADEPERVAHFLNVVLVSQPQLLREAQRAALAAGVEMTEADEVPEALEADEPLPASAFNVYRVLPPRLNSWERAFAEYLDRDLSGTVQWWHRNPSKQPWSVRVLLSDGHGFFPDFIIGVRGRPKKDGALLADTKFAFELRKEMPKILAEHRDYGRALILHRESAAAWMVVKFNAETGTASLGNEFRFADAPGY